MTAFDPGRFAARAVRGGLRLLIICPLLLAAAPARGDRALAGTWLMEDDYALMAAGLLVANFEVVTFAENGTFEAGWWSAGQPYAVQIRSRLSSVALGDTDANVALFGLPDWGWPFPVYATGRYETEPPRTLVIAVEDRRDVLRDRRDLLPDGGGAFAENRRLAFELRGNVLFVERGDGRSLRFRRIEPETLIYATYLIDALTVSAAMNWRCALEAADHWLAGSFPEADGIDTALLHRAFAHTFEGQSVLDRLTREAVAALPPPEEALRTPETADQAISEAFALFVEQHRVPNMDAMMAASETVGEAIAAVGGSAADVLYRLCPNSRRQQLAERCMAAVDALDLLGPPQADDLRDLPKFPSVADRTYGQCACLADATLEALPQEQLAELLGGLEYLDEAYGRLNADDLLLVASERCRL